MADDKIRIDIESVYDGDDAQKALKDAEKIEDAQPVLEVDADTSQASGKLEAVSDEATRLTSRDWVTKLLADTASAKSDLEQLQGELDQTGDHAKQANEQLDRTTGGGEGSKLRGNAIADLTGPLGDASGAASDFAGVFDGLGDTVEAVAGKLGLSEQVAGGLASAVGGLGVVVAAGAAAWTLWKNHQEEARKKAEELTKQQEALNDAIEKGDRKAAAANFDKLYGEALDNAHKLGVSTEDFVKFLEGASDTLPGVTDKVSSYNDALAGANDVYETRAALSRVATDQTVEEAKAVVEARDRYKELTGATADATDRADDIATALLGPERKLKDTAKAADTASSSVDDVTASFDRLNERLSNTRAIEDFQTAMQDAQKAIHDKSADTVVDIRGVEDAIVHAGEAAKLNPIDVETAIQKADQGDIDGAFLFMQQKIDEKGPLQVQVALHATIPKLTIAGRGGTQIVVEVDPVAASSSSSMAGAGTVNVNLPRGYRGDVVSQVTGAARRNGRRYGARGVNRFARR